MRGNGSVGKGAGEDRTSTTFRSNKFRLSLSSRRSGHWAAIETLQVAVRRQQLDPVVAVILDQNHSLKGREWEGANQSLQKFLVWTIEMHCRAKQRQCMQPKSTCIFQDMTYGVVVCKGLAGT